MVTLSKIIDGLEMVDDMTDCYYNPEKDEINEYQIMVDFIETIDNLEIKNNLQRLIHGKGAFRRFKDYCIEMGIIQDWYDFRDKKYKEIAIAWCKQNELEYR